jgi:hypothetical protein
MERTKQEWKLLKIFKFDPEADYPGCNAHCYRPSPINRYHTTLYNQNRLWPIAFYGCVAGGSVLLFSFWTRLTPLHLLPLHHTHHYLWWQLLIVTPSFCSLDWQIEGQSLVLHNPDYDQLRSYEGIEECYIPYDVCEISIPASPTYAIAPNHEIMKSWIRDHDP